MNKFLLIVFSFILFLCNTSYVNADSNANISFGGNGSVSAGAEAKFDIVVSNIVGSNLMGVQGVVSSSNNNCLKFDRLEKVVGSANVNNGTFAYADTDGVSGTTTLVRAIFVSADNTCNATITIATPKISFTDGTKKTLGTVSKSINVIKLSTNNNLSNLTVDKGALSPSFNKDTTSYAVSVKKDVTSININATKEDNGATITGTGNKTLNYGSNKFNITVKAENGSTKYYTIIVNREDSRSKDATLKNITINNGTLSPSFNSNTTSYNVEVPYEVSKLNINATPNDSKAKVSISNPDLVAEEVTKVIIKVTAENGSTKEYIINVKRGKDPNKVLNNDNKLISLTPSIGILSPLFSSDINNYFIYLPYEVEEISFAYEISDKRYGKVEEMKVDKLIPNTANKFSFIVKAEDESINTYTVTVYRAKNPLDLGSSNVRIKELILNNGELLGYFDSALTSYQYKRGEEFSLEVVLEDNKSTYKLIEQENDIYIIVEAPNGDIGIYCLHEKVSNNKFMILIISIVFLSLLLVYFILDKFLLSKLSNKKKIKKEKKSLKK